MKNLQHKLLEAINRGLKMGLELDGDPVDNHVFQKAGVIKPANINDTIFDKVLHSRKLQAMLPNPLDILKKDKSFIKNFVYTAIGEHEKYGATYNPHLDGQNFKEFVRHCYEVSDHKMLDLNWINTSEVTDMSYLFAGEDNNPEYTMVANTFKGDISEWDVSHVTNMKAMFQWSTFNGDIKDWNVSNVTDMSWMFRYNSKFNQDLHKWNVSHVITMEEMFSWAEKFNQPIGNWNVSNVRNMWSMFKWAKSFNQDISDWNVLNVEDIKFVFHGCPIEEKNKPHFKDE